MHRSCPSCGEHGGRPLWHDPGATAIRCQHCRLAYVSYLAPETVRRSALTYERIYAGSAEANPLTATSYERVLGQFEPYRALGTVLDIGCGAGAFLLSAVRAGWTAVGTESAANAGVLGRTAGARVLIGERATSELPDRSFDVITLWEVIEHVDGPPALLAEAWRLLRPGGALYLTTPNHYALQRRLLRGRWPRYHAEHLTYYDPRTISLALERAGFGRVRTTTKNFDPFIFIAALQGRPTGTGDEVVAPHQRAWATRGREGLRATLKRSWLGRGALTAANAVLGATGLGDTLVAQAERR